MGYYYYVVLVESYDEKTVTVVRQFLPSDSVGFLNIHRLLNEFKSYKFFNTFWKYIETKSGRDIARKMKSMITLVSKYEKKSERAPQNSWLDEWYCLRMLLQEIRDACLLYPKCRIIAEGQQHLFIGKERYKINLKN